MNQLSATNKTGLSLASLEDAFLIQCSRINLNSSIKDNLRTLAANGLNWTRLINRAKRQGVAQFLYCHLSKMPDIWQHIPRDCRHRLYQVYFIILNRNQRAYEELKQIVLRFDNARIRYIVLKGMSLLGTVYRDIGLRYMSDIDLLINKNDFPETKSVLSGLGYRTQNNYAGDCLEEFGGEMRFYKPGGVALDIHSDLSQYERFRNVFKIDLDGGIWSQARTCEAAAANIRVLDPQHLILNLSLHQAIGHFFVGLFRFCDMRETVIRYREDIDWQYLIAKAKKYKMQTALYYSLFLTQQLFGDTLSDSMLASLRAKGLRQRLKAYFIIRQKILSLPGIESRLRKYMGQLLLMDNSFDALKVIIRGLFPSSAWLTYTYRIKRKIWLVFYRIFHPVIIIFRMALR